MNHNNKLGVSLFLCKPTGEIIDTLDDIKNIKVRENLDQLSELSFSIDSHINHRHKIIVNPLISKIKHKFLVKMIKNKIESWFVVTKNSKKMNEKNHTVDYTMLGLARQIGEDILYDFSEQGKYLKELSDLVLDGTMWKTGYIDGDIINDKRGYEASEENKLQTIFNLAKKFSVIPVFKDKTKTVDYMTPDRLMKNKGFRFEKEHFLESFNVDYGDEIITKLHVYGDEGLTIRRLSPTGSDFLLDYSYFLYPFEIDSQGNVIRSSNYMTDGLCIAWFKYQKFLGQNEGKVATLVEKIEKQDSLIFKIKFERGEQKIEVRKLQEEVDILNSTESEQSLIDEAQAKLDREQEKLDDIEVELQAAEKLMKALLEEKSSLTSSLAIERHLTRDQIIELKYYTNRKNVTNDSIIEDEDLLKFGKKTLSEINHPSINVSMNIRDFKSRLTQKNITEKIELGDEVLLYSDILKVDLKVQIRGMEYDLERNSISVQLSNGIESNRPEDLYNDILTNSVGTSTTVNFEKYKWREGYESKDMVSQLLNNVWDATKNAIVAGVNQSVVLNERGLTITSSEDPNNLLIAQNGVLALSKDGGKNWRTAITPDGVYAENIVGKLIMGNRLHIEDENGIISITGDKLTVFNPEKSEKVIMGQYEKGKYGLKINDGAFVFNSTGRGEIGVVIDGEGITGRDQDGTVKFKLDNKGNLLAKDGLFTGKIESSEIKGSKISGGSINIGGNFIVDGNGNLTSTNYDKRLEGMNSKIEQTSNQITMEVNKTLKEHDGRINAANTKITQTANEIRSEASRKYTEIDGQIRETNSKITQTSSSLTSTINSNYNKLDSRIDSTNSKITQTSSSLTSEINSNYRDLNGKIGNNSSSIRQLDREIDLKVNKNGIISAINLSGEGVRIQGRKIDLVGTVRVLSDLTGNLGSITAGRIEGIEIYGSKFFAKGSSNTSGSINIEDGILETFNQYGESTRIAEGSVVVKSSGREQTIITGEYVQTPELNTPKFIAENITVNRSINARTVDASSRVSSIRMDTARLEIDNSSNGGVYGESSELRIANRNAMIRLHSRNEAVYFRNYNDSFYIPIYAKAFTESSKREFKKNIEDWHSANGKKAIELVKTTPVRKYHFKEDKDEEFKRTGLIVDECPVEIVNPDGEGVEIYAMTSLLWKAVQDLNEKVEILEGRLRE